MTDHTLFNAPNRRETAVDTVVNRFRELLLGRRLRPGDLIPSEGVLAQGMGVSRSSVREAMKILSALGVVEIRQGDGTRVSRNIGRTALDPFMLRLMMNDADKSKLLEFREMIECDVARAAVRRKDGAGLARLSEAVTRMREAIESGNAASADMAGLDLEFHRALGAATGNPFIEQLYDFVLQFFEDSILRTYRKPDNAASALAHHERIERAIASGSEEAALAAVRESVLGWAEQ